MSKYHSIIKCPSITERNTLLRVDQNKYVFEVEPTARKPEIREAVEKIFGVNVVSVNTSIVKGKRKRVAGHEGFRKDRKKAIVKIKAGQEIAKFGEV